MFREAGKHRYGTYQFSQQCARSSPNQSILIAYSTQLQEEHHDNTDWKITRKEEEGPSKATPRE